MRDQIAANYNADLSAELLQDHRRGAPADRRVAGPAPETDPLLYLDAISVKIREDGALPSKAVCLAIGVDCAGRKQLLGMRIERTERAKLWLKGNSGSGVSRTS